MLRQGTLRGAALIALAALFGAPAIAEPRVALVIGNSAYKGDLPALANPSNDAKLMAKTLADIGFTVIQTEDADQIGMKKAIGEFGDQLAAAGPTATGLFFYAGHGLQVRGENYLIPVDAKIEKEADVDLTSISAETVLKQMDFAGAAVNIVILDACRNNPLSNGSRGMSRGLAELKGPARGSFIAYSTAPGSVANDGDGANSPYTTALAATLREPGLSIGDVFQEVRSKVAAATGNQQKTWDSNSLTGQYYFKAPETQTASVEVGSESNDLDTSYWNDVKDSTYPADYQAYLKKYPDGNFAQLAKNRIKKYESGAQTASLAPDTGQPSAGADANDRNAQVPQPSDAPQTPNTTFIALDQTVYARNGGQVRAQPDSKTGLLSQLQTNAEVKATGRSADGKWWRVALADGQTGYMHKTVVGEQPLQAAATSANNNSGGGAMAQIEMDSAAPVASGSNNAGDLDALGQVASAAANSGGGGLFGTLVQGAAALAGNNGGQSAAPAQMVFAPMNQTVEVRAGAAIRATPLYSARPTGRVSSDGQMQAMGRTPDGLWWQVALPNGGVGYLEGRAVKR